MIGAFGGAGMLSCSNLNSDGYTGLMSGRTTRLTGIAGLAVNGFLLFAVPAGFSSFGIMSLGMVSYTLADTLLLFFLLTVAPLAGIPLFNRGANRLRLSKNRNESWGKNLFVYASLVCIFLVKKDFFSLTVSVISGLTGLLGQFTAHLLSRRGSDGIREFAVGTLGGAGTALGIVIADRIFPNVLSSGWFVSDGKFSGYIPQGFSLALAAVWCLLWVLPPLLNRKKNGLTGIWLHDTVFCALPFLLLALGNYHTACLFAIPLSFFVCAESQLVFVSKKTKFTVLFALLWLCASALVLSLTTSVPAFVSFFGSAALFLTVIFSSRKIRRISLLSKIIPAVSFLFAAVLWFLTA